jgi:putative acetyltransferase
MCRLRDYCSGDESQVFELVKQVLAGYGLGTNPEVTDSDLKDISQCYLAPGGTFKILEHSGQIIGSYGLYPLSLRSCELRKMYLVAEYRGRGLGKRMMDDALREAKTRGFREMVLETNSCLQEAVGLYRAYGFE